MVWRGSARSFGNLPSIHTALSQPSRAPGLRIVESCLRISPWVEHAPQTAWARDKKGHKPVVIERHLPSIWTPRLRQFFPGIRIALVQIPKPGGSGLAEADRSGGRNDYEPIA